MVTDLLHAINCDTVSINNRVKIGKKPEDSTGSPRPLLIEVASEAQKENILSQAKNLKGNRAWQNVWIRQDLTPKQRQRRQQMVQEMKQRKEAGEANLIIVNNKIVKRRARTDNSAL